MTLSRNQREGYYSGYFRKHYRSRFNRLGQRDDSYFAFLHPEPNLSTWEPEDGDEGFVLQAAVGEHGTIDRFRFITTS